MTPEKSWTSPHTRATYPVRWRMQVPSKSLDITIAARLPDQEMRTGKSTGVTYWEGSVSLSGTGATGPVTGAGYVELTGYAGAFDAPL